MKEHPIIFSGPMVRSLLAGTKTQTRRIVNPQPEGVINDVTPWWKADSDPAAPNVVPRCPYGLPGDRLWVRETARCVAAHDGRFAQVEYKSDGTSISHQWPGKTVVLSLRWSPSIHMPRWASRITLEIIGVRVERLQQISAADAIAEGVDNAMVGSAAMCESFAADPLKWPNSTWVGGYRWLWESINGPDSWDADPWVWVIEFRKHISNGPVA